MPLSPGSRLGPYEILAPLGAGGMGEVYRAKDARLGREVAIKVLPASFSADADRLRRFEQEARAASALNHPNIITIHDIGSSDATSYIAMEFVDGTSLRELLASGPLTTKRMLDVGAQIGEGLAKAHSVGIVHRDLKPENVMVSKDGFVKILDFGLAKLFQAPTDQASGMPTVIQDTQPGTVMGTVGYMSPEQASGKPVDFRSDQFAFGSILYEMATGKRAFQRDTGAETLTAIIRDEPEPVAQINPKAPAPFRWIVERCLAKDPDERYVSTRDLARDLKSVREHISEAVVSGGTPSVEAPRRRGLSRVALGAALLAAGLLTGVLAARRLMKTEPPSFRQLTFRRGEIQSARFASDGQTVAYSAAWEGRPLEIFFHRLESPESRPADVPAGLLAVSMSGEMAISLNRHPVSTSPYARTGRLARVGIGGGAAPRDILEDVQCADWSPDGQSLAIVRDVGGRNRLEYPVGKTLYETAGWISHPRVSRRGDMIAFCDHSRFGDDSGSVAVVDRAGKKRTISGRFSSLQGLAWAPGDEEIWFTAAETGANRGLHAVTRSGHHRLLARVTGSLTLQDVAQNGRVLATNDDARRAIVGLAPGESRLRELSWLDYSGPRDLSADGTMLLLDETGEGGGEGYSVYLRKTDGSPATRLGPGLARRLSPDGKWALAVLSPTSDPEIVIYPTSVGEPRRLPGDGLTVGAAEWCCDGKSILMTASEPGHGTRVYLRGLEGGKARALTPEGYRVVNRGTSPDGRSIVVIGPDQGFSIYPVGGGEPVPVPGVPADYRFTGWSSDGKFLFVHRTTEMPPKIYRLDPSSGKKELWKELLPTEGTTQGALGDVILSQDGQSYVYSIRWIHSDLYLVDGVK